MKKFVITSALALGCALGISLNAQAQSIITWQSGVTLTGSADVNTTGTTAVAYNATVDGGPNATINGVTFTGTGVSNADVSNTLTGPGASLTLTTLNVDTATRNNQGAFGTGGFIDADADLGLLIAGGSFNLNEVQIGGLTVGDDYLIQTFVHDGRGSRADAQTAYSNGVSADVDLGSVGELNEGGVGSFITGTFTAAAETLSFNVFGEGNSADANGVNFALDQSASAINGIQVRNVSDVVTVPEPSSLALLGLAGLGLVTRRRR